MSDPRFARLKTDPRFRSIKRRQHKVAVDDRFKSVLGHGIKKDKVRGQVDKYGRALSSTHEEDNLKRFYRLENEEEEEAASARPDYARGGVLMESSDEEDEEDDTKHRDSDSDDGDIVTLGGESSQRNDEDPFANIDLDENEVAVLDAQAKAYAEANPEQDDDNGTRTRRLAIVNLDWDHVRAAHLYKICASLVSPTAPPARSGAKAPTKSAKWEPKKLSQVNVSRGKVLNVVVYPSDFGKERMTREEKEGPPIEIFKKQRDDEEVTEKSLFDVGGEDEVNENALRKYQLDRLRYYYAIVTCDTVEAASHIHDELQGTELERSANVFDISFVPDDMTFDNEPRDQATQDATNTKPLEFVTDALRHSKVKLTWDDDDPERDQVTRRAMTEKEIEDGDFRAYIASSSGSESEGEPSKLKKSGKKKDRNKLRNLLLGGNEEAMPEGWGDEGASDVDMEITFTPGLSEKADDGNETTLEKYQRKMREKRKKRKEEVKGKATPAKGKRKTTTEDMDEFFQPKSDSEEEVKSNTRKGGRKGKDKDDEAEERTRQEATAEELALLATSNNPNGESNHFDFKAVVKSEKAKAKKSRRHKKSKGQESNELQEDFVMDVQDERFKVLHEDHQFAIDPSNPHFKKTKGMSALLEERRKRNKKGASHASVSASLATTNGDDKRLERLVESVKRKTVDSQNHGQGQGKRRKL